MSDNFSHQNPSCTFKSSNHPFSEDCYQIWSGISCDSWQNSRKCLECNQSWYGISTSVTFLPIRHGFTVICTNIFMSIVLTLCLNCMNLRVLLDWQLGFAVILLSLLDAFLSEFLEWIIYTIFELLFSSFITFQLLCPPTFIRLISIWAKQCLFQLNRNRWAVLKITRHGY